MLPVYRSRKSRNTLKFMGCCLLSVLMFGCGSDSSSSSTASNPTVPAVGLVAGVIPVFSLTSSSVIPIFQTITTMNTYRSGSSQNQSSGSSLVMTTPDMSTLTDIKDITDRSAVLRSVMNKGYALKAQDLETFFIADPNYGTSNGLTRAEDVASIVTIFGPNGINTNGKLKSISNVQVVNDQTANYAGRGVTKVYLINYDFIHENGSFVHGNNTTWAKDAMTGLWEFIGDPANAHIGNNYGFTVTFQNVEILNEIFEYPFILDPPVIFINP